MVRSKWGKFYCRGVHKLPERWENVQQAIEQTLNKTLFIILPNLTCFLRKRIVFHTCTPGNVVRLFRMQDTLSIFEVVESISLPNCKKKQ